MENSNSMHEKCLSVPKHTIVAVGPSDRKPVFSSRTLQLAFFMEYSLFLFAFKADLDVSFDQNSHKI